MPFLSNMQNPVVLNRTWPASGSRSSLGLNAAYVHGTSGPGFAIRYLALTADPIDEAFVFLDAVTGTLGNISMRCRIYNEHASSATQPGSTLRATATTVTMPGAVDRWVRAVFGTPYTPTVGEVLWIVWDNTAGAPATDFPQLLVTHTTLQDPSTLNTQTCFSSTAGFSAAGTAQAEATYMVKQGTLYTGKPYTATGSWTSNQLKRGVKITPPLDVRIAGIVWQGGSANYTGIQIFDGSTAPGGSALHSFNLGSDANESRDEIIGGKIFDTPVLLSRGATYRIVLTYGANTAAPAYMEIEDQASFPSVFAPVIDNFSHLEATQDNGASGWTDFPGRTTDLQLLVYDFPLPAITPIFGGKVLS